MSGYKREDRYDVPQTPVEVLKLALEKERASFEFYEQILQQTEDPNVRKLLESLRDSERGHVQQIKSLLDV